MKHIKDVAVTNLFVLFNGLKIGIRISLYLENLVLMLMLMRSIKWLNI